MDFVLYVIFSILTFYAHYIFASVLIVQNIYYVYMVYWKKTPIHPSPREWVFSQIIVAITIPVLLFQLSGMFENRVAWDWLRQMDLWNAFKLLLSMFDPKVLAILAGCFLLFYFNERINFRERLSTHASCYFLLFSWLLVHFLFIFGVSKLLGISLLDTRYLVLCLIPFFFIMSGLLHIFKSDILRVAFPGVYIVIYLGFVSIPNYMSYGHFSYRIPHNWRGSVAFVNKNYKMGDVILLRAGFVNENWIPSTDNKIVHDYVKAPFRSFYWKKKKGIPQPTIYNLTYTWEKDFYPYYDMIFDKAKRYERIWIIGVHTPNTNYPVSSISTLLEKEYEFTKIYEANYSGVYLCLMSSKPYKKESLSF